MSRSKFNKCYTMKKDSIDVGTNMTEADNISGKRMQFSERKDGGEIKKKGFYIPHAITELAASGKFESEDGWKWESVVIGCATSMGANACFPCFAYGIIIIELGKLFPNFEFFNRYMR